MERPVATDSADIAPWGSSEGTTSSTAMMHMGSAATQTGQKRTPRATEAPPEMDCGFLRAGGFMIFW